MLDEKNTTESLSGIIIRITYQNQYNGYTVATVNAKGNIVTVVGNMPFAAEGDDIEVYGNFVVHPTFGRQFKAVSFEKKLPTNAASILRYLSTGVIKGVGPSTARKIVELFGDNTLQIIKDSPEKLSSIKGISPDKARFIGEQFIRQFGVRDVMLLLGNYKISTEDSLRVFKVLGNQSVDLIKSNPYILCSRGIDFPFDKVETIAESFEIPSEDKSRICAGIEYVLRRNLLNGHTCLPVDKLLTVSCRLLGCDKTKVAECLQEMCDDLRLAYIQIDSFDFISIPEYYYAEEYAAARLLNIDGLEAIHMAVSRQEIEYVENSMGIKLDQKQIEAVKTAFDSSVFILTGGPGTGKTTTLKAIIELFEYRGMNIELAAPTGRAAKRMTELTSREAKTLHRLLEVEWSDNEQPRFARNEQNPLDCDIIIVDEVSMVDSLLFESLLRALRMACKIILVGDTDQLPSVSAGNVLNDLIACGLFKCVRLNKIFRQAEESAIITNAHAVIAGNKPNFTVNDTDMFFLQRNYGEDALATVLELVTKRLPGAYKFDPVRDIQVLCPSRKMLLGTMNLNSAIQNSLNPATKKTKEIFYKGVYLRTGDKVMQIKNNYELSWIKDNNEEGSGVFNGDVGFIEDVDVRSSSVKVRFDDKICTYTSETLSQLEQAYAITVHKSQGSEFDCVILPLYDIPEKLCYRNLLYTAITRAKKLLVLVGKQEILFSMAENDRKTLRYTMLKKFLQENK